MGRQLFLHHYLPAHLASALVTGALIEFVFNVDPVEPEEYEASQSLLVDGKSNKRSGDISEKHPMSSTYRVRHHSQLAMWAAAGVVTTAVLGGWYYFLPLTYGRPGLSVEQVLARKWLGYDLHFAK